MMEIAARSTAKRQTGMGDINWDKVEVEKLGTGETSSRKLREALKLKKLKGSAKVSPGGGRAKQPAARRRGETV